MLLLAGELTETPEDFTLTVTVILVVERPTAVIPLFDHGIVGSRWIQESYPGWIHSTHKPKLPEPYRFPWMRYLWNTRS